MFKIISLVHGTHRDL